MTKAQEIQQTLAEEIVKGRLKPGTSLDETVFAANFGVSRTPIREAIRQLEAIGLVETRPHRGAVVTDISVDRLENMFAVMAELETLCAGWAATAMSPEEKTRLEQIWEDGREPADRGDLETFIDLNELFHETIYEGAHNPFLAEMVRGVKIRLMPFRRLKLDSRDRLQASQKDHAAIVAAIRSGDAEAAREAMRQHTGAMRSGYERMQNGQA